MQSAGNPRVAALTLLTVSRSHTIYLNIIAKGYSGPQARQHRRGLLVADLKRRVQSAGLAGVGAMVILNSVYYTGARALSQLYDCACWFHRSEVVRACCDRCRPCEQCC